MNLHENFSQQKFVDWISSFLPDFSKDIRKVDVSKSFQGIKSIHTIGESALGVRVYIIETEQDPSRRKIGLATESFTLLRDYGTPNAIVAYYSDNSAIWRLSLLTSNLTWDEGKIKKKLSNPKRQSYVLGSKAKVNTPHKYLITKGSVTDFNDLKSRFSLEVVNKEFYKEISHAFIQLVGGQIINGKSKKYLEAQLKLPSVKDQSQISQEFTVRLIGRIIFCWFLREKRSASGHSLMPRELLSFEAANTIDDYYHKILEPIFFEVLNKRTRKEVFINELFSAIPYLNGGLFSPHEDDFFDYNEGKQAINHNMVIVPDQWLKSLFEVLETYNFTIDENTSFDEELSIDPEMLGRIFENLLAEINPETGESARKSTGSYYTPRVIVDYMVDESLYLYLKDKTNIPEDKLRSLISYNLEDASTSPLNEEEKDKIAQSLGSIKILDPACGSGAFPIGALQKIVFILQQIDQYGRYWFKRQIEKTPSLMLKRVIEREFKEKNFDYIRKLGIIQDNIFGVDIQPIATEISRLRCFLTLIVDERVDDSLDNRGVEPLPNLDFKFVTANTLVGLPKLNIQQTELFDDHVKIERLKELIEQYFTARDEERKDVMISFSELQSEMINELIDKHSFTGVVKADLTRKLTDWKPFKHKSTDWFDPEWMFGIKDGFDIVIANPPYISYGLRGTQKMTPEERKILVSFYPNSAEYKISIYAIFMDKAIQLAKDNGGIQTYIVPDSFLLGRYFSKIRGQILNKCEIVHISWMPYKIFEATVGFSVVYTFQKKASLSTDNELITRHITRNDQIAEKSYQEFKYKQSYFKKQKHNRFRMFFDQKTMNLINKIEQKTVSLGDYFTGRTGVRSLIGQKNIISKEKNDETWQKGLISGGQIHKYCIDYEGDYINIDPKLLNKGGWDYDVIHSSKILVRQTADSLMASLDINNYYHLNNIHSFVPKYSDCKIQLKYLLALINSKLFTWFYQTTSLETGRAMAQTDIETLECLPIKNVDDNAQNEFIKHVNVLLELNHSGKMNKDNPNWNLFHKYIDNIDLLVYKLYDLTPGEIAIVEGG